jgi:RNA recognition motif-containing protein
MIRTAWTDRRFLDAEGVGFNHASSVTSRNLLEHFSRAGGALSALAVIDPVSGLCRGFGFVEMAEVSDVAVVRSFEQQQSCRDAESGSSLNRH